MNPDSLTALQAEDRAVADHEWVRDHGADPDEWQVGQQRHERAISRGWDEWTHD